LNILFAVIIFGLLILIHEFGHFLIAKKNGVYVTEFSLGMGPRLFSFVKGETRYALKLLPFGGSCMMLGEDEEVENDPRAFHAKSVWSRIAIVAAGPIFNFILAIILAIVVIGFVGIDKPTVLSVEKGMPMYEAGLREGDIIVKYDGSGISVGREIYLEEIVDPVTNEEIEVVYERDGKRYTVDVTPAKVSRHLIGMSYSSQGEAVLSAVTEGSALKKAGLEAGDIIKSMDGNAIASGSELAAYFEENPVTDEPIVIAYERDGKETKVTVTPTMTESYSLGWNYNLYREKVGAFETIKYSFLDFKYEVKSVFKSLGMLFTGKVTKDDIAGPVGIVDMIGDTYEETKSDGWFYVFMTMANLTVLLSANLGVMNLLPIPALDGGRLVFLFIEAVTRKPVPKDKEAIVHLIGMILLMALMVFILFNDIFRIFFG